MLSHHSIPLRAFFGVCGAEFDDTFGVLGGPLLDSGGTEQSSSTVPVLGVLVLGTTFFSSLLSI